MKCPTDYCLCGASEYLRLISTPLGHHSLAVQVRMLRKLCVIPVYNSISFGRCHNMGLVINGVCEEF